jgi:L-ascorbate metabolism protein UlaG (beta-lactamase superfamily)
MHPLATQTVPAGSVAIHWFEQSSYAIKDPHGTIVQIDPYFPRERPGDRFIHPQPPLDESQLPTDFVLLTHNHGDHTCPESIQRIEEAFADVRYFGPPESIENIIANAGVPAARATTVQAGDEFDLRTMTGFAVYAKPPDGDPGAGIQPPDVTHLGYVIRTDDVTLYFSGDPINTFADHDELVDAVAALQPDIGFLTTHPTEGEFPFFEGSVKMAQRIGLQTAVPAHYQCFVKRNYDPQEWAAQFPADGPSTLLIPHNSHVVYAG